MLNIRNITGSCGCLWLQLVSSLVGRILGCRDLLASVFLPFYEGHILSYVSHANVIYATVSSRVFSPLFTFYGRLWLSCITCLLALISTILNVMDILKSVMV